jgi:ribosome-binding protein aMBF1 (putative translation factor)
MKRIKGGVPLDEVFAESEKDPRWKEMTANARVAINLSMQISKAREKAKMTQRQLAKAIGTTQSVISRIEVADQNLTIETLTKIALALNRELVVQFR